MLKAPLNDKAIGTYQTRQITWNVWFTVCSLNLLNPTGYVMHQRNIQQLYALPTLYLCFVFIGEQTATCATYSVN